MACDEKTKTLKNLVSNCCTALFLRLLMDNTIPITHHDLKISVFFIDTMLIRLFLMFWDLKKNNFASKLFYIPISQMGWKMFLSDSKCPVKQFAYIYNMRVSFMFFYFHSFFRVMWWVSHPYYGKIGVKIGST